MKSWATFEDNVRDLASAFFGGECAPSNVGGVDLDGVINFESDIQIFIEITERRELAKVREDVLKLRTAKSALLSEKGVYARCFCIVKADSVTPAMVEAGEPHQIKVLPFDAFKRMFFDFRAYRIARESAAFGSAVNPLTGKRDERSYVKVKYLNESTGNDIDAPGIADLLSKGRRIVLLGEYGSGKSRCLHEVFRVLAADASRTQNYPVAIDLRESWGLKRGVELVRRHLEDLGQESLQNSMLRALRTDTLIFMFDGFDELGSQAWSDDGDKLRAIRARSLEGVKDLVGRTSGGIFISGREHYFNNNDEMLSALGLTTATSIIIRCRNEFTEEETAAFFSQMEENIEVPMWIPRRPLICQIIADLSEDDLDRMFGGGQDEIDFWDHFVTILCERDARIHASFDAVTIKRILVYLSRLTRARPANVGPITLADTQAAFESVVGQTPVEDASVMLQRLPALGRLRADSNDRQFIDMYILDGLRATDVIGGLKGDEAAKRSLMGARFTNPLDDLGQRILGRAVSKQVDEGLSFARRCLAYSNKILACDIVASLLRGGLESVDFHGLEVDDGHFIKFDMSKTLPRNLTIRKSVFGSVNLPSIEPPGTHIVDSLAERVFGTASGNALPKWLQKFTADHYDSVESISRIRKIGLDPRYEILVTIIRKTFFQKGSGRKEEALTRGLGRIASPSVVDKIVNVLLANGVLSRFRGDEGWVYAPNRQHAGRMKKLVSELKLSQDPLWIEVGKL